MAHDADRTFSGCVPAAGSIVSLLRGNAFILIFHNPYFALSFKIKGDGRKNEKDLCTAVNRDAAIGYTNTGISVQEKMPGLCRKTSLYDAKGGISQAER